jgi:hypothetical protein
MNRRGAIGNFYLCASCQDVAGGFLGANAFDQAGQGGQAEGALSSGPESRHARSLNRSPSGADALGEVAVGIVNLEGIARRDGGSVGKDDGVQFAGAWGATAKG